jgi:hypothetical protein
MSTLCIGGDVSVSFVNQVNGGWREKMALIYIGEEDDGRMVKGKA